MSNARQQGAKCLELQSDRHQQHADAQFFYRRDAIPVPLNQSTNNVRALKA